MLFKKVPENGHLRVFGCLCFAVTLKRSRHKKDVRGRKCAFISYPANVKGCTLYDLEDHSIFISRDVQFYEKHFPFKQDENTDYSVPSSDDHIILHVPYFPQEMYSNSQTADKQVHDTNGAPPQGERHSKQPSKVTLSLFEQYV